MTSSLFFPEEHFCGRTGSWPGSCYEDPGHHDDCASLLLPGRGGWRRWRSGDWAEVVEGPPPSPIGDAVEAAQEFAFWRDRPDWAAPDAGLRIGVVQDGLAVPVPVRGDGVPGGRIGWQQLAARRMNEVAMLLTMAAAYSAHAGGGGIGLVSPAVVPTRRARRAWAGDRPRRSDSRERYYTAPTPERAVAVADHAAGLHTIGARLLVLITETAPADLVERAARLESAGCGVLWITSENGPDTAADDTADDTAPATSWATLPGFVHSLDLTDPLSGVGLVWSARDAIWRADARL